MSGHVAAAGTYSPADCFKPDVLLAPFRRPVKAFLQPGRKDSRKTASRRDAFRFGFEAERSIRQFLRAGDYRILGTRVLIANAELDLVVARDDTVAFVEVKARRRGWDGLESIDARKIRRITRGANAWLSQNERHAGCNIRFDIALVWSGGRVEYLENAFEPSPEDDFVF